MTASKNMSRRSLLKNERIKLLRFLEELSWVLRTHKDINLKLLPELLIDIEPSRIDSISGIGGYISPNPNIHFLVGTLPAILDDQKLFPSNEDISTFAYEVLKVRVPRWQKKSKYEIIGHVICSVYKANDKKLTRVVSALGKILSGDKQAALLLEETRSHKMNWNDLIQVLSK